MDQQTVSIEEILRKIIREELAALKLRPREALPDDKLLTAAETARILDVSERWLYRHAATLSYAVRLSPTVIRFSRNRIQLEIQKKLKVQG